MRRLIALPVVMVALGGAIGCGEEKTVSDDEIVEAVGLEQDGGGYAIGGDPFCQVGELLNDAEEVEAADDTKAQVISDSTGVVGIEVVTPFDPRCEEKAQRALNKLGKEEEG